MSRMINADELWEKAYWHGKPPDVDNPYGEGVEAVDWKDIENAPTIDAVEVVRCKDCDNWVEEMKVGYPEFGNVTAPCVEWSDQENGMTRHTRPDDYCSYGYRKEN